MKWDENKTLHQIMRRGWMRWKWSLGIMIVNYLQQKKEMCPHPPLFHLLSSCPLPLLCHFLLPPLAALLAVQYFLQNINLVLSHIAYRIQQTCVKCVQHALWNWNFTKKYSNHVSSWKGGGLGSHHSSLTLTSSSLTSLLWWISEQ